MWVLLMSVLVLGVPTEPTNLANLRGKWTVGLGMSSFLIPTRYSILWRPWKTVGIGIEGEASLDWRENNYDYDSWYGSTGIGLYKYFRAHSSFSPFIGLSPQFGMHSYHDGGDWRERETQEYRASLDPGIEYFFAFLGKQLSLRFKTHLVSVSRTYRKSKTHDGEEDSNIYDRISFYLPTAGYLSTWLCFHF